MNKKGGHDRVLVLAEHLSKGISLGTLQNSTLRRSKGISLGVVTSGARCTVPREIPLERLHFGGLRGGGDGSNIQQSEL